MDWLLEESQPSVRYFALTDLLGREKTHPDAKEAVANIAKRGWAAAVLAKQKPEGNWESKRDLYRPKYTATNWMAIVLSDLGLTKQDGRIAKTAELFFADWMQDEEPNIFHDEVCIVGNTARLMTRFGYGDDPRVKRLFGRLVEDQRENGGWHCREKLDGVLDGWEALAAFAALPKAKRTRGIGRAIERGVEFYLERGLLDDGEPEYRPWFRLHYPVHYYYDVLVGLDVISSLGYGGDGRMTKALEILKGKRTRDGAWLLEKLHPDPSNYAWGRGNLRRRTKPFGLEQEGLPSKWMTLTALRVLKRVEDAGPG
jgi:hypothetical protein